MRTIRTLLAFIALAIPATLFGQVSVSISIGPPALPFYEQPICPGDGYLWTPGYWAYDNNISDYYWVDGQWVMAPEEGFLWTPGYWGWGDRGYRFNEGYWGPQVGFYGGINYGHGYYGEGYGGGRWDHGHFFYDRSENRLDTANIHNVYDERVDHGGNVNRVSYNGGKGGIEVRATSQQEAVSRERHVAPVAVQTEHAQTARANPELRASTNHGKPPVETNSRPQVVNDHQETGPNHSVESSGTTAATESHAEPRPESSDKTQPRAVIHPNDLAPIRHPEPANSGNAKGDKKYQQQQDDLIARQNLERQSLQQKQDSEHQRVNQQKHQQQTQQMSNKHTTQQQSMQSRRPQPKPKQDHPDKAH